MGVGRRTSAISALALALGMSAAVLAATPAGAADCDAGGLLSSVTSRLCGVGGAAVDSVTGALDGVTGGADEAPGTASVDTTVGVVSDAVGTAGVALSPSPTNPPGQDPASSAAASDQDPSADAANGTGTCDATARALGHCGPARRTPTPIPAGGSPRPSDRPEFLPAQVPRPSSGSGVRPRPAERDRVQQPGERVDVDRSSIPLLWPGGFPSGPRRDHPPRPAPPVQPYDPWETALTAALLLSAVLATRAIATWRGRALEDEREESLPLSGLPARSERGPARLLRRARLRT